MSIQTNVYRFSIRSLQGSDTNISFVHLSLDGAATAERHVIIDLNAPPQRKAHFIMNASNIFVHWNQSG